MSPWLALIIIPSALTAWFMYLAKDRMKEIIELKRLMNEGYDGKKTETKNNGQSPERKCSLCKFKVAEVVKQVTNSVRDLRWDLLDRQMKLVENMCERLTHTLGKRYFEFLRTYRADADFEDWEMRMVRLKIELAMKAYLIPGMRSMLKENHLADRTDDEEWTGYKRTTMDTIEASLMAYVSTSYIKQYSVPREAKYDHFRNEFNLVVVPEIHRTLDEARALAIIYENDIRRIEQSVDEEIGTDVPE